MAEARPERFTTLEGAVRQFMTDEKAQQGMFFLQQLKKFNLAKSVKVHVHAATTEYILTSSITIWYAAATADDKGRLQRIIRSAEKAIKHLIYSVLFHYQEFTSKESKSNNDAFVWSCNKTRRGGGTEQDAASPPPSTSFPAQEGGLHRRDGRSLRAGGLCRRVAHRRPQAQGTAVSRSGVWPCAPRRQLP
ncbi:hypothetical protein L3Q82_008052 [Scortum barcoo]|uniref:Uncharacterized protein n=1 Tax=Scortum barcoo TaxID=214431 RepID=A0ACB8WM29_9TELE|nr:hypothetical protein L3Q82_008052 [Scortum barcoo]